MGPDLRLWPCDQGDFQTSDEKFWGSGYWWLLWFHAWVVVKICDCVLDSACKNLWQCSWQPSNDRAVMINIADFKASCYKITYFNNDKLLNPFNSLFSSTTWVSQHQKGKQFWILVKQEIQWQWHQLDHMQLICTSLQTDNHASTTSLKLWQAGCPPWCQRVKVVKAYYFNISILIISITTQWDIYSQNWGDIVDSRRENRAGYKTAADGDQ